MTGPMLNCALFLVVGILCSSLPGKYRQNFGVHCWRRCPKNDKVKLTLPTATLTKWWNVIKRKEETSALIKSSTDGRCTAASRRNCCRAQKKSQRQWHSFCWRPLDPNSNKCYDFHRRTKLKGCLNTGRYYSLFRVSIRLCLKKMILFLMALGDVVVPICWRPGVTQLARDTSH